MTRSGDLCYLFRHYYVSKLGEVFSTYHGGLHELKPRITSNGYARVLLSTSKGESKEFLVHRLVAMAFLTKIWSKPQVNHKDRNRLNNRADNLEWCTPSENVRHAFSIPDSGHKPPDYIPKDEKKAYEAALYEPSFDEKMRAYLI